MATGRLFLLFLFLLGADDLGLGDAAFLEFRPHDGNHALHDDRFRILTQEPEEKLLQPGLQWNSIDTTSPAVRYFASGRVLY